jgi:hypothetical protein
MPFFGGAEEVCNGQLEVSYFGEAAGANGSEFGRLEAALIEFYDVPAT